MSGQSPEHGSTIEFTASHYFTGPAISDEMVSVAEGRLGVRLPASYVQVSTGIRVRALPPLVAAACEVGGLGSVARQLDGLVVRRARLLNAAQPAQQIGRVAW